MSNREVFTFDQAKKLPQIGALRNNWRRRHVSVHQHPTNPNLVVTIGIPFDKPTDQNLFIVVVETADDYTQAIRRWPNIAIYD